MNFGWQRMFENVNCNSYEECGKMQGKIIKKTNRYCTYI